MYVNIHVKTFARQNGLQTSQNGLKVAKAGHKSEGHMGMMANSYDSERLRGGGMMAEWHYG